MARLPQARHVLPVPSHDRPAAADPHPGNISVNEAGALIYYDWGMVGTIPSDVRAGLLELFYGVYEKVSPVL